MPNYFIDTHTHLFSSEFAADRILVINRAIESGTKKMLLPNVDSSTCADLIALCSQFPDNCFPMMGLHPTSVKADFESELEFIEKLLFSRKFIAVGEIGLDLYWDKSFLAQQVIAFEKQIAWAKQLNLPIVVHARNSFAEIFEVFHRVGTNNLSGVFHAFTGNIEEAELAVSQGFKIGIGGIVTFKNSGLDKVVEKLKLTDLVLETDSPYLAPIPYRGKRNESSYIMLIAKKIAEIFDISIDEVARTTTKTASELFRV